MQKLIPGEIINIQAFKHNGTLYRQWNGAKVIEVSEFSIVLFLQKTKVTEKSGQKWVIREPMLWWFPTDRWFNTSGLIRNYGTYFYTNISSLPFIEDKTLKFIDYDLDIKAYPKQDTKIVDQKEFEHHKLKYNYNPKLIKILERTTQEVIQLIKNRDEHFDEEVVNSYVEDLIDNKILSSKFVQKIN